ncbi:MAG: Smr/MutS family protein [Candidatus Desulfatibia sp.]|uniref:Smr/MutS family protein n=1 Tax=Candidatus Desulfatibia sp. TaxID=3101189 RepID=UPI002F2CD8EB
MDREKGSKPQGVFRPFKDLKTLLKSKSFKLTASPADNSGKSPAKITTGPRRPSETANVTAVQKTSDNENDLFVMAMADVKPIARDDCLEHDAAPRSPQTPEHDYEAETLLQLEKLVKHGEGFVVAHTPEYIEGTGYNVHPQLTKRLHRGDFSIQAHLDLHGLGVKSAKNAFDKFFKDAITTGKGAVLIVHGRGLSSPAEPVLKTKVVEWLTGGPWRKWVVAFTSARSFDGGAGATYVLLRQRPVTRSQRKKKKQP